MYKKNPFAFYSLKNVWLTKHFCEKVFESLRTAFHNIHTTHIHVHVHIHIHSIIKHSAVLVAHRMNIGNMIVATVNTTFSIMYVNIIGRFNHS